MDQSESDILVRGLSALYYQHIVICCIFLFFFFYFCHSCYSFIIIRKWQSQIKHFNKKNWIFPSWQTDKLEHVIEYNMYLNHKHEGNEHPFAENSTVD